MKARYLILTAACLAPAPAPAQSGGTPAPAGQVRRDLESVFQPGAWFDTIGPYGQTGARARLRTRPYATSVLGVCRRDEVILDYAGRPPFAGTAADNAVGPYGVAAEGWYRVLRDAPTQPYGGPARAGECTALDGAETRGWFVAADVYVAAGGHRAMAAARAQVAGPSHAIAGCRESRQARAACRTFFSPVLMEQIGRIDRCEARPRRFCFRAQIRDESIVTVHLRYDGRGAERIEGIGIEYPTIMVQTR